VTNRRRLRLVLPFAVLAVLVIGTVAVHVAQQPDPTDAAFLSPSSDAGVGARRLADDLTRNGIWVDVQTNSADVLTVASSGESATVLVTTPELVNPAYLRRMVALPPQIRLVLVAPDVQQLADAGLDVAVGGPRWTAAAPQPGCALDVATAAGRAAVLRRTYQPPAGYPAVRCYQDALVELGTPGAVITLVGAVDPFRNDRAFEHGNQALVRGLLDRSPRVIWLDLHERERDPAPTPTPTYPADHTDDGDEDGYGDGDGDGEDGYGDDGGQPGDGDGTGSDGGSQRDDPPEPSPAGDTPIADSPLVRAFPPGFWAALVLLALAALALAAASARRLGAPVAEPLPVRVHPAETVRGLGGLYRRAGARGTSLATLQTAACRRLTEHFALPPDTGVDVLAEHIAAAGTQPATEIRHVLGGGIEDSDEELARAATTVQNLVRAVTGQQNWQPGPDEENLT
jgi:hypothetical protein